MTNLTKALVLVAVLVLSLVAVTTARAATQLSFAGQSWHVFKATGRLGQVWDPSQVSVTNGTVNIAIDGNKAGGIGSTHWQTYGTYSADFRITAGAGKGVLLLKGHEGTPFNELDFAETSKGDSGRTHITATRHWGVGKANMCAVRPVHHAHQPHPDGPGFPDRRCECGRSRRSRLAPGQEPDHLLMHEGRR
jgi:hypothetical protein